MCPQHGIKHLAAFNNSKYCVHTVIAAVCFILFCGHINKHSHRVYRKIIDGCIEFEIDIGFEVIPHNMTASEQIHWSFSIWIEAFYFLDGCSTNWAYHFFYDESHGGRDVDI